jgi:hypothetical protein
MVALALLKVVLDLLMWRYRHSMWKFGYDFSSVLTSNCQSFYFLIGGVISGAQRLPGGEGLDG